MATQKIYATAGTPATFKDSGGTVVITLQNLANTVGRISAQWDRGAGASLPIRHRVRCVFPFQATHTVVVGTWVSVYMATSDGTNIDGTVGAADAALTANQALNLKLIGIVVVDAVAADQKITGTFDVDIYERYVSIGVMNNTADHLQDDANACIITITPYPEDIQAAA
jgi:hypothetical protein